MARVLVVMVAIIAGTPAAAHDIGLGDQVLAPVTTLPSLLPLLAVSLLCRQHDHIAIDRTLALVLAAGVAAGLGARLTLAPAGSPAAPSLALATVAGALVALARPLPRGMVGALLLALGLAIGASLHTESPALLDLAPALGAGFLGAFAPLLMLATTATSAATDWHRIGVRVAGSWIVAAAVIALALGARDLI
jgi:urease accessory protein